MPRFAFHLRIRPDRILDYDEAHKRVWPELLAVLKQAGISEYSIFRRDTDLILCMRTDDFDRAWDEIDRNPVNQRWQREMAPLFEPMGELQPGERFPMLREVFYLE